MERFFEMSMVLYIMSVVINTLLIGASMSLVLGGLGLPPLILQTNDTNNLFTSTGLNQHLQDINITKPTSSVQTSPTLPTAPSSNLTAFSNSFFLIGSIMVTTPFLWKNVFDALGYLADSGGGAIFLLFTIIGSVLTIINLIGMAYALKVLLSIIRGVVAR